MEHPPVNHHCRLIDHLSEARRYVKSDPEHAAWQVHRAVLLMVEMTGLDLIRADIAARLGENLLVGCRYVWVDPEVLRGYITGACLEIQQQEHARNRV